MSYPLSLLAAFRNHPIRSDRPAVFDMILVSQDATKRVIVPHEDIGDDWRTDIDFDDSAWKVCSGSPGGIGYERSSGYESLIGLNVETDMHQSGGNPNNSCYIRIPFTANLLQLTGFKYFQLYMRYDDGFIAYLNGKKIAEANAPESPAWNSNAAGNHEADTVVSINISDITPDLKNGQNLLAVHGLNSDEQSSDFLITVELIASDDLYGDFTSTNLPLVLIDTGGQGIPDAVKIEANMKIIDNGPGEVNRPDDVATDYDGRIGIEIRGASSSGYPQRPYGFETRDEFGNNLNVSLLDMPAENDWALLANYNEKSLVRTILAFDLFREMGQYAPRAKLCEVFVNNTYQGIYVFTETIKRDNDRVDISRLTPDDSSGDNLTGGYIIKVDYHNGSNSWVSDYSPIGHPGVLVYFVYHYPKPDEITGLQKSYIQGFIRDFEAALYGDDFDDPLSGYREYIDVASFIDYFIISEVSRNVDGYKKSRYLYKDKNSQDDKLYAGPVWDFDWAWKNIREGIWRNTDGSGWSYRTNDYGPDVHPPGWYVRLLQDSYFTTRLIDRYIELRSHVLDLDKIFDYIDAVRSYVDEAQERHFDLWPIDRDYRAPEVDPPSTSYDEEIEKLKRWIELRINWLDENIPRLRDEIINGVPPFSRDAQIPVTCRVYPNPATDVLYFESKSPLRRIEIFNVIGQMVFSTDLDHSLSGRIEIDRFQSGVYFVKWLGSNRRSTITKQIFTR